MKRSSLIAVCLLMFAYPLLAQDAVGKFTIHYPEGWKITKLPDGRDLAEGPDEGHMHATMNVAVIPVAATPLKDLLEPNLKTMAKLSDYKKVADDDFTIEGQKGRKLVFTHTAEKNVKIAQVQYWVVINQNLYLIDCTAADVSFEKTKKLFEDAAKTLSTKGK